MIQGTHSSPFWKMASDYLNKTKPILAGVSRSELSVPSAMCTLSAHAKQTPPQIWNNVLNYFLFQIKILFQRVYYMHTL
jgi:hypothetical protein